MLGKTEGRRRRRLQRMGWLDGITNTTDMSLSKFQKIVDRKPGELSFMGSQRAGHDLGTEQHSECPINTRWINTGIYIGA